MTNVAVIGSQWGDEGKGKIVDWLSQKADVIVRFQGGHNAGHTLVVNNVTSHFIKLFLFIINPLDLISKSTTIFDLNRFEFSLFRIAILILFFSEPIILSQLVLSSWGSAQDDILINNDFKFFESTVP